MKFAIILACLQIDPSISIDCLNQCGQAVDWWVILKMPTVTGIFPTGHDYYYCDELSSCSSLVKSDYKVTDFNRTFLKTIAQVTSQPVQIVWNDQLYNGKTLSIHAQSKGLIAGDITNELLQFNIQCLDLLLQIKMGRIYKIYISLSSSKPYVCFCDMNRQDSQVKRGGTGMCLLNSSLWKTFNSIMFDRQLC